MWAALPKPAPYDPSAANDAPDRNDNPETAHALTALPPSPRLRRDKTIRARLFGHKTRWERGRTPETIRRHFGRFYDSKKVRNTYTKEDHAQWLKETQLDQMGAKVAAGVIMKLVELMLVSAARPGVRKSNQVFHALIQVIEKVKDELRLEKHIDAELRDRHSTETKRYAVRELRDNDLLAKSVGFEDNPKLNDHEVLTLTKATGWLPAKECFNVWWQHRELVAQILKTNGDELPDETRMKLEQLGETLEKTMDKEVGKLMPFGSAP